MPALTRRRDPDALQETWPVYFGDIHAGTIRRSIGNGRTLITLKDAGAYITKLPKVEHDAPVMGRTGLCRNAPRRRRCRALRLQFSPFKRATITNLDQQYDGQVAPYSWERQDAEALTYGPGSFDVAVVHAGLHHCASPHRALLEMYRVAAKAVIVFEARDSALIRLAVWLGFTNDFELEAVSHQGYETGGWRNGPIPNLNYRWVEREVIKLIRAADPAHEEDVRFFYGLRLPTLRFEHVNAPLRRLALKFIGPLVKALVAIFPRQGNEFGFVILKTGRLRQWLEVRDGKIRLSPDKAERRGQAYS